MITENILKTLEAGLGHGETAIFPIVIFKVKEGINYNTKDPNYDLFKLACRVSAKRLFPNFSFIDAPFNLQYYKENEPDTEIAYMGCVQGDETVRYRFINDPENEYITGIKELFEYANNLKDIEEYGISEYIDTEGLIEIYEPFDNDFVPCNKVIRNPNKYNWVKISFDNGIGIKCTTDHPFPVHHNMTYQRTLVKDIKCGDFIPDIILKDRKVISIENIELDECSYDVETGNDKFCVSGMASHNCRTRVIGNVHDKDKEIVTGRGNLSFTSINLPRLAIESKEDINTFFVKLDEMMDLVIAQLTHRFKIQAAKTVRNYPFLMGQHVWLDSDTLSIDDTVGDILKHGSLSVGFIGLAEALKALTGYHHGENEESRSLGYQIVKHMRDRVDIEAARTNLNFTLLATPAEGLSGRFVSIDADKYGIIEGVTDRAYYTNSFHVPVYYKLSAFEKIKIEAPFHQYTNAGHISYIELDGDPVNNISAFEKIVRCMKESGIGYGSINHPVDRDPVCGYTGIIYDECPMCGRKESDYGIPFDRIRRITGYLVGTLDRFNDAKLAEVKDRLKHDI